MQINNNSTTPSFNGYKNVLANSIKRSGDEKISYISMQLNNTGNKDLDIWKSIQKKFLNREETSDVITFNLFECGNENILGISHELLDIENTKKSSEEESIMLKAYSLIASLTKRIMSDYNIQKDNSIKAMAYETKADLADVFMGNKQNSAELDRAVWGAFYPATTPQEQAKKINQKINETMIKYFAE